MVRVEPTPDRLHEQLCERSKIVNRTPETLALPQVQHRVAQAFDDGSVDMVLADFEYPTEAKAARVARAANDWAARHHKVGMLQV